MRLAAIPRSHPRGLTAIMLAALVAIVLGGFGLVRPRPGIGLPLRGHGAAHDWLLVVDSEADRLAVYAIDGRPLGQLDADAAAAMLDRHDGRVLVIAGDGPRDRPALRSRINASGR